MKLLFATDGSERAESAAQLVAGIAEPDRIEITVMSVTPTGLPDLEYAALMLDPIEDRRKDTLALVDHWAGWFKEKGFDARAKIAEGRPGEEIVHAVERDWYDLTVLGSGRSTWLGTHLLGSVSTHVLHSSPSSVLIVHRFDPSTDGPRAVMAVDGSRSCEFAARATRELLVSHSKVRVVSCFAPMTAFALPGAVSVTVMPSGEQYEQALGAAERRAQHFANQFVDAGYEAEAVALWGQPQEQILKDADSFGADIVVVGSRGLGPMKRALLGSVSDQIVRHAPATLVGRRLT